MTASELLQEVYTAFRGKIASKTPTWGSDKANIVLEIANRKTREWARDPYHRWDSLFSVENVGTINTSTFAYNLDADFLAPSDYFLVQKTNGDLVEVSVTKPNQRLTNDTSVYISGRNPKKVTFAGTSIESSFSGGTLKAPGYYMPASLVEDTDVVAVDDPTWLVYAVAAELARNDPAKEDQFGNLMGMANDLYTKMITANDDIGYKQGGTIEYNLPQIGDYSDNSVLDF